MWYHYQSCERWDVLFLTSGASSSHPPPLLPAQCQPVHSGPGVTGEMLWEVRMRSRKGGGDRSVSWNVNEISLYLLFPLDQPSTPNKEDKVFWGVKLL